MSGRVALREITGNDTAAGNLIVPRLPMEEIDFDQQGPSGTGTAGDQGQDDSQKADEDGEKLLDQAPTADRDEELETCQDGTLDFHMLLDKEDLVEAADRMAKLVKTESSPLEPPSVFMNTLEKLPELQKKEEKVLTELPRKIKIKDLARGPFLGALTEEK